MSMSFLSNAAMRLHPVEWASGSAAGLFSFFLLHSFLSFVIGASAAFMAQNGITTTAGALASIYLCICSFAFFICSFFFFLFCHFF